MKKQKGEPYHRTAALCPTCGAEREVATSGEGTGYFVPMSAEVEIRSLVRKIERRITKQWFDPTDGLEGEIRAMVERILRRERDGGREANG